MLGYALGFDVLVVGVEEQPEGWTKVFIGARYENTYVVPIPGEAEEIKRAWEASYMGHLTMRKPDSRYIYSDDDPYVPDADGGQS